MAEPGVWELLCGDTEHFFALSRRPPYLSVLRWEPKSRVGTLCDKRLPQFRTWDSIAKLRALPNAASRETRRLRGKPQPSRQATLAVGARPRSGPIPGPVLKRGNRSFTCRRSGWRMRGARGRAAARAGSVLSQTAFPSCVILVKGFWCRCICKEVSSGFPRGLVGGTRDPAELL